MHHAAGTACKHDNALWLDALDRQTERMHRPTLLEKSSATDNLCHRPSSHVCLVHLVYFVYLVCLVHVSFNQKNQTDQTNHRTIFLEGPKGQHYHHANHVREHTRIEHCGPRTVRRHVARQLLFVDEFTGENQHRERQGQRSTCSRPGVGAAEEKVRREKSAEEENQRRQDEPDCVGKKRRARLDGLPPGLIVSWDSRPDGHWSRWLRRR